MPMFNPPHPGRSLKRDCIEALELTITEAADRMGITRTNLSNVVNQHSGISPELAIRLEKMGWGTADSWLAMQHAYELAQARKREAKIKVRPYKAQPVLS